MSKKRFSDLNDLQAIIEELEQEIDEQHKIIEQAKRYENGLWVRITKLEKENEQLEKGKMEALSLLGEEIDKNEQLRQVVEEYRKTNKHLYELCADASKNGYLPPLEDLQ